MSFFSFLFQMKYLVYFYKNNPEHMRMQVVLLSESQLILGEYHEWSLEDWRQLREEEVKVRAIYDDDVYLACILMVVTEEEDNCDELIRKLRCAIMEKNFKPKGLINYCGTRVKPKRRMKVLPMNVSHFLLNYVHVHACI